MYLQFRQLRSQFISVMDCICRKEKRMLGAACGHPANNCFTFGKITHYWVENGEGRHIAKEEAQRILTVMDIYRERREGC